MFDGVFTIFPGPSHVSHGAPRRPEAPSPAVLGGVVAPCGAAELCLALRRGAEGTAAARWGRSGRYGGVSIDDLYGFVYDDN